MDIYTCEKPKCGPREIILLDGKCSKCTEFTKPSLDLKSCTSDACNDRQKVDELGSCTFCPLYERAQDRWNCGSDNCTPT